MGTMTFESQGLYIVAIYIWLPPASYVVFLTTLVRLDFVYNISTISNPTAPLRISLNVTVPKIVLDQ